jgi:hypothetical protein
VVFDTDGEGIANLTFTAVLRLEDGTQVMVDYSPIVFESVLPDGRTVRTFPTGVSEGNSFAWNVETLMISDGATQIPATLFINSVGISQGAVSGTYVSQAGNEVAASVIFDINTWRALSTYGTSEDGATFEITPQPGDKFFPNWYFVTDQGLSATRATDSLVYGVNPFSYDFVPAASGNYRLTMILEDLAGNVSVSSADVIVDNADLDTTYRGYKDIYTGINFLYPWGWSDPTQLADESGQVDQIVITNPDGDIRVYIAMRDQDIDTAAQDMVDLELSLPDGELIDPLQPYEDDPAVAQFFTYSYSDEGEARVGMVIIVRVEENAATYTFDIDAPEAKSEEASAIIQKMAESITFFSPLE